MKICFGNKRGNWNTSKTGKGKFASRLIKAWGKMGIETTTDPKEKVDVDLQISKWRYCPVNATIRILRRGPVYYDTNIKYKAMNHEDSKDMKMVDGVVYQSDFSKKMNHAFVCKPEIPEVVIFNGADPDEYKNLEPAISPYKYNFLASTREWVWEKRLEDIIESFFLADIKNSCLWICGAVWENEKRYNPKQKDFQKKYNQGNIRFLGNCNDETVGSLYKLCNAMVHIVYVDACPNSVVEALVAGCKVISNNTGGQEEIVKRCTPYAMKDPKYDFKKRNRRKPPTSDRDFISQRLKSYCYEDDNEGDWMAATRFLHIDTIAKQYLDFFRKVLDGTKKRS